nr:hypothetical protein BaRGS_030876 [Batillaria attramentaria]
MDSGDGRVAKEDLNAVLAVYAMNELTDEEYLQLIANKATDCDLSVPAACDTGEITTLLCHEPSPASSEEFVPFDGSSYPSASHGWLYGRYDGYDDDRSPNGSHATLDTEAAMCDGDILDLDAVQGSDTEGSWYSCALDVTNLTPTLNFSGPLEPTGSPWVL